MALQNTSLSITRSNRLTHYFRPLEYQTTLSSPSLSVPNVGRLVLYFLKPRILHSSSFSVTHAGLNSYCGHPGPQPSSVPVPSPIPLVLNFTMLSPSLSALDRALSCQIHSPDSGRNYSLNPLVAAHARLIFEFILAAPNNSLSSHLHPAFDFRLCSPNSAGGRRASFLASLLMPEK